MEDKSTHFPADGRDLIRQFPGHAFSVAPIQPLSGTSSLSNDTVRFTAFLFTMAITLLCQ